MKHITIIFIALFAFSAYAADFSVKVPTAKSGVFAQEQVFNGFGCTGGNVSPEVVWENPPQEQRASH